MTSPTDIFRESVNAMLCNVHTSLPGIVKAFDPSTNKATIQPALNKNFTSGPMPMPVLENVPVMFPKNITFPLNQGDYVLLIFVERSIDLWISVGGQVTPTDPRKFDLSDAIAIPGLLPFNADFSNNNGEDFSINFAGSAITIKANGDVIIKTAGKIAIGNQVTEVLDVISQFLGDMITAIYAPPGGTLDPATALALGALQTKIDALKGTIT